MIEHLAKGVPVDRAGLQAKPNDATSVLIHDDQNPVSPQHRRFAAKDAERQSNLLSDSGAAPGGIALFGGDDRVPEFLGRTLGTGLAPAYRREERAGGSDLGSGVDV